MGGQPLNSSVMRLLGLKVNFIYTEIDMTVLLKGKS